MRKFAADLELMMLQEVIHRGIVQRMLNVDRRPIVTAYDIIEQCRGQGTVIKFWRAKQPGAYVAETRRVLKPARSQDFPPGFSAYDQFFHAAER